MCFRINISQEKKNEINNNKQNGKGTEMENGNHNDINSKETNQQNSTLSIVTKRENTKMQVFG